MWEGWRIWRDKIAPSKIVNMQVEEICICDKSKGKDPRSSSLIAEHLAHRIDSQRQESKQEAKAKRKRKRHPRWNLNWMGELAEKVIVQVDMIEREGGAVRTVLSIKGVFWSLPTWEVVPRSLFSVFAFPRLPQMLPALLAILRKRLSQSWAVLHREGDGPFGCQVQRWETTPSWACSRCVVHHAALVARPVHWRPVHRRPG